MYVCMSLWISRESRERKKKRQRERNKIADVRNIECLKPFKRRERKCLKAFESAFESAFERTEKVCFDPFE